jgi:hypothetical protein
MSEENRLTSLTIGMIPRDRYSLTARVLQQLFENSDYPFDLLIVLSDVPHAYRAEILEAVNGREGARVIDVAETLAGNRARNILLDTVETELLLIMENDIFVEKGWLSPLVAACTEGGADVAVPLLFEPFLDRFKVHFDGRLGTIEHVGEEQHGYRFLARPDSKENDLKSERKGVHFIENHCVMYQRSVFERIGRFDEEISVSRSEVDISMAIFANGGTAVLEPKSRVVFRTPPPVQADEIDFFRRQWEPEKAREDEELLIKKWNIEDFPSAIAFAEARHGLADFPDAESQLAALHDHQIFVQEASNAIYEAVPKRETLIFVDDMQLEHTDFSEGRTIIPFKEKEGVYWGKPASSEDAVEELERLRGNGASYFVLTWPSFWWRDHYAEFFDYLSSHFAKVTETDCVLIYKLAAES